MKAKAELSLSIEEIEDYNLEEAEEKLLYIRYLIRREQKEYMLIKYQYFIEYLERHIHSLSGEQPPLLHNSTELK